MSMLITTTLALDLNHDTFNYHQHVNNNHKHELCSKNDTINVRKYVNPDPERGKFLKTQLSLIRDLTTHKSHLRAYQYTFTNKYNTMLLSTISKNGLRLLLTYNNLPTNQHHN